MTRVALTLDARPPSSTPTIKPTSTITPAPSVAATRVRPPVPPGMLFAWNCCSEYGTLDPEDHNLGILPIWPSESSAADPKRALDLEFSPFSSQVAYLDFGDHTALWVSDVRLDRPVQAWVDKDNWFGVEPHVVAVDHMLSWGPGDQFVLLSPIGTRRVAIYRVLPKETVQFNGACNGIGISPESDRLSVWCPIDSQSNSYVVLEISGRLWYADSPPAGFLSRVSGWSLSPSGDEALVADRYNRVSLLRADGTQMPLAIVYAPRKPGDFTARRGLQWSRDGSRVLVYGSDRGRNLCPLFHSVDFVDGSETLEERPCWHVFDTETARLLWYPTDSLSVTSGLPIEDVYMDFDAALSPDGDRLAVFAMYPPFRRGFIVSIQSGTSREFFVHLVSQVTWSE